VEAVCSMRKISRNSASLCNIFKVNDGTKRNIPQELKTRVKFIVHEFFNDQCVVADVYLLRAIFHN
jgi:hypothetical protein